MNAKNSKKCKDALNELLSDLSTLPQWEEADEDLVSSLQKELAEKRKKLGGCLDAAQKRNAAVDELRVARQAVAKHVIGGRKSALSAIDGAIARFERDRCFYGPLALDLGSRVNHLQDRLSYVESLADAKRLSSMCHKGDSGQRHMSVGFISDIVQTIKFWYAHLGFKDPFPKVRISGLKSKKK
ncbi:MAG: hypothetical protein MJZ81_10700 [Bacteroidales bacterium]|nr:hypothetical protein [Bacteroidales bacterium]